MANKKSNFEIGKEHVTVSNELFTIILNYLSKRPFDEVFSIMRHFPLAIPGDEQSNNKEKKETEEY